MRFDQFEQIIERIEHEVPCPKCRKNLSEKNTVEILSAHLNDIHVCAKCSHCGSRVEISAQVESRQENISKKASQCALNAQKIEAFMSNLQNFKGENIADLF